MLFFDNIDVVMHRLHEAGRFVYDLPTRAELSGPANPPLNAKFRKRRALRGVAVHAPLPKANDFAVPLALWVR